MTDEENGAKNIFVLRIRKRLLKSLELIVKKEDLEKLTFIRQNGNLTNELVSIDGVTNLGGIVQSEHYLERQRIKRFWRVMIDHVLTDTTRKRRKTKASI